MQLGAAEGKSAADEEIQEFIFDVESTAKKILKKHNMKKQADAKRDCARCGATAARRGAAEAGASATAPPCRGAATARATRAPCCAKR